MMAAVDMESLEYVGDEQLLLRTIDIYECALIALTQRDTPRLNRCLKLRRQLLEAIKGRARQDWDGADVGALHPLIDRVRDAEERFIDALDQNVERVREGMVHARSARKAHNAYASKRGKK